ncbi:MAG: hypothetical protein QG612_1525 [Pseudomonadota bacterium]|nr:hypothetical protein [Pseudomonadota bacterium]
MCLAVLAIDHSRRFPLVLVSNRDEFFDRPASRLGWWTPPGGQAEILSGRDQSSGGTWLGLSATGRLALLTNVRDPRRQEPEAPTRGTIVPEWLSTDSAPDRFWVRSALRGHNGFNLIAADFARGDCWWMSNHARSPVRLERGLFGLSNAGLDTPWPKVVRLREQVAAAMAQASQGDLAPGADALAQQLLALLADRHQPEDEQLPATGVPLALERELAPIFVRTRDGRYGTRCSTVLITERIGRHLVTQVYERSHPTGPGLALMRRATLKDWPPRYQTEPVLVETRMREHRGSVDSPVRDEALDEVDGRDPVGSTTGGARVVMPRVRGLLKPARPKAPARGPARP